MKLLEIGFYLVKQTGGTKAPLFANNHWFGLVPLSCMRARPQGLFKMPLQHLAFFVSGTFQIYRGAPWPSRLCSSAARVNPNCPF